MRIAEQLERLRRNPHDCRIEELQAIAAKAGMTWRKPSGSHVIFTHPEVLDTLSIPARRPIKPVYVRLFVQMVEKILR